MEEFARRQLEKKLREYPDYFEYRLIDEYETTLLGQKIHCFEEFEVEIQCFFEEDDIHLVSLIFNKSIFDKDFILQWLSYFGIQVGARRKNLRIPQAKEIDHAFLFLDHIVARYVRGPKTITVKREGLMEWTILNQPIVERIIDTKGSRLPVPLVVFNNEIVPYCPTLKFNRKEDVILVNGTTMNIDRIEGFNEGVGYYRKNIREPIAYADDDEIVFIIDLFDHPGGTGTFCSVVYVAYSDWIEVQHGDSR
ncbi:hypothetical protein OVA29_13065 [Exiguobacterium sp. SL14]|nr:hypothetical protein [Exiguobacterium sp. SL14]MCY1691502.1 hypothetical protein [Exiguobacterium sp. SL14]